MGNVIIFLIFISVLIFGFSNGQLNDLINSFSNRLSYAGFHVEKNYFVDKNGKRVVLRGASRWSLEFSCGDGHFASSDFRAMKSWGMNIVRIPFNENFFLNPNLCSDDYQKTLFDAVDTAKTEGLYVLLDMHWIHPKEVNNLSIRGGQYPMPDMQALEVWEILAKKYKNDPQVLFEFMNEPHEISCSVWRDGGAVVSKKSGWIDQVDGQYETPGFQKLVDLVRNSGADNIIIQGASGEANLTCASEKPLSDPVNNLAYQSHFYTTSPDEEWKTKFKDVINNFPVIAGEFDRGQALKVLPFFENDLKTGYMFWVWSSSGDELLNIPNDDIWEKVREFMISADSINI